MLYNDHIAGEKCAATQPANRVTLRLRQRSFTKCSQPAEAANCVVQAIDPGNLSKGFELYPSLASHSADASNCFVYEKQLSCARFSHQCSFCHQNALLSRLDELVCMAAPTKNFCNYLIDCKLPALQQEHLNVSLQLFAGIQTGAVAVEGADWPQLPSA